MSTVAKGKSRPDNHILGERGVNILKRHLPEEWVVREYHPDYGIDLSVELFEQDGTHITKGAHLLFQVKSTERIERSVIRIKERPNIEKPIGRKHSKCDKPESCNLKVIKYPLDTDFLATVEKMGSAVPVILSVVDVISNDVYFLCLNDYIEKILVPEGDYTKNTTKTIYIPASNVLTESSLPVIEWYAKRPRFYALFNKIRYQSDELEYANSDEITDYIDHFIKTIYRFDVWEPPILIPYMEKMKRDIDYYLENGITADEQQLVYHKEQLGEDVDAIVCEATYCAELVSFREAMRIQGLHRLWKQLANLGNIFEEDCKEYFLPTWYWCLLNS